MERRERGLEFGGFGGNARHVALVLGVVFAAALAVVVGRQMSTEAMAVVVGLVCGIAASIPTSLLLLVVLTRRDPLQVAGTKRQARRGNSPPAVAIQASGGTQGWPPGPQAGYWPAVLPGPTVDRQFHIVGGDGLTMDGWNTKRA